MVDGWRAEETARAYPDVQPAPGVKGLVDERQSVGFTGNRVGIVDEFGLRIQF